jgi:hypothetical protein
MHRNLMFQRGSTFQKGTQTSATYGGVGYEGAVREIVSESPATLNPNLQRTAGDVIVIAVRNVGARKLLAKYAVIWSTTAGEYGKRVTNYVKTKAGRVAGIVDEFLPAGGIPVGDMGWIVVKGHSLCVNQASSIGDISIGDRLVAITATATDSQTTDPPVAAGRVQPQDTDAATTPLADQVQNVIGTALSDVLSNDASADVLVDVELW